jgi:hypothetical protein
VRQVLASASGGRDAGTAPDRGEAPLSTMLGVVLAALLVLSLSWTVRDFWDARPDAARYLLAARSLASGEGYAVMGEPFRLRPPGFSVLLAPLVAWRGFDFATLNLFVSLLGVVAVVLFYLLLVPRVGVPVALAAALVVWLNAQVQALSNQVLSDVPGLACALAVLLVLRRANARASLAREVVLGLALAAAVYVRSANLLLLPAVVLDRLCRRAAERSDGGSLARFAVLRLVLPLAVCGVLYLPWLVQPSVTSQYDSPDLHSYATAFLRSDPNDPTAPALGARQWLRRLGGNVAAYAAIFASGMTTRRGSSATPLVAALGLVALLLVLARRREAPEWFALGTIGALVAYYVPATRLLLPAWVLIVGAMAEVALALARRVLGRAAGETVVALAALAVAAASIGTTAQLPDAREREASLRAAVAHVAATVPEAAPLGGDVGAVYALLLDRPVYSLRPLTRRGKRRELARLVEEKGLVAVVARSDGPLAPVARRLAASGGELAELPHHVVVHLPPRREVLGAPQSER